MVVLGGDAVFYERGTPVLLWQPVRTLCHVRVRATSTIGGGFGLTPIVSSGFPRWREVVVFVD